MPNQIESDKLLVQNVFEKWFRIPEYQRPYVWEEDQVTELLDDISDANGANPEAEYFLGSLVLRKREKTDCNPPYTEYDILDGQQRLTTLSLIHAVIRDSIEDGTSPRFRSTSEAIFMQEDIDNNRPERMRIVFDIRDDVKEFIYDYIKPWHGTDNYDSLNRLASNRNGDISIRNMAKAIKTIKNFFNNGHSIDEFYRYLRTRVLLIYVAAENLEDAFHLFTVMNNRGIKLRNSDILKAENLAKVQTEDDRILLAKMWENIEEYFGEEFDSFLSHLRTVLVKSKASYNLLREYEDNIYKPRTYDRITRTYHYTEPLLEKGENTFDFIGRYFKHYNALFDIDSDLLTNNLPLKNKLTLMRYGFEADSWIPPLLSYYNKYGETNILDFVEALDNKFSADWITAQTPTTRIENMNKLIKVIEEAPNEREVISDDTLKFLASDLIRVFSSPIYGRKYAKYLLLKIDLHFHGDTTGFAPPEKISIEHILPQNPPQNSRWLYDFTNEEREYWVNRIGNLVLISRRKNSSLGNLDYEAKKNRYFSGNIELFSNSIRILNDFPRWRPDDLKNNHKKVLNKLLRLYNIELNEVQLDNLLTAEL